MLSTLTQSVRRKLQPDTASPEPLHRSISFPDTEEHHSAQKRSLFRYRNLSRHNHPPRDADHDDSDDEQDPNFESENEEEDLSDSHVEEESPLLPIFSSAHLNALPIFTLTHTFRELVAERCDTVLTWDQLRSPQVSQFLVKPIQLEIIANHMNAGTHYALLANSLQFMKEAGAQPANSGTNKTRAMVCELIAIKLLRECNTRELIDALSYDFDPLQGQNAADLPILRQPNRASIQQRAVRISCIEIAIRASAKRFLAHPSVVSHLEAIWNGSVVFYAAADSMHRRRKSQLPKSYGTIGQPSGHTSAPPADRWTASLYNPKEASLFKLSRLRVPRYRNTLSTISFAILLTLFLFVNQERSLEFSPLELVFWIWAAGYMLDEVIGFTDQGFSLYIASFWNTFDLGILILLLLHLVLRLYGFTLSDRHDKLRIVGRAYDILAFSAILLFPRLFSILDHYRYFSQLIIAFRMMAADMVAICVLILVFCSGFLVALTFAFGKGELDDNPRDAAYVLLQMLLGFTPAVWDRWDESNYIQRTILTMFLAVCHFVVITILITVMTNSFMEVVRNANEEHQFLFAVNVISSVKSDALFAYVPPTNVLQWLLTPLRFILPFREYIKVNRTIIKVTHFPILWTIYLYERLILRPRYVDTTDLVESRGRAKKTANSQKLPRLRREPSIATYRQEAALEEVFRQPTDTIMRLARSRERRKSSNVVNSWINNHDDAEPPQEEDRKIVDKLEQRRYGTRRMRRSSFGNSSAPRRAHSDQNDLTSYGDLLSPRGRMAPAIAITPLTLDPPAQHTDADGDDELLTNDADEHDTNLEGFRARSEHLLKSGRGLLHRDYFHGTSPSPGNSPSAFAAISSDELPRHPSSPHLRPSSKRELRPSHARNASSATMIYNPPTRLRSDELHEDVDIDNDSRRVLPQRPPAPSTKPPNNSSGRKTPKRTEDRSRFRPRLPSQENKAFRSTPNIDEVFDRPRPNQTARTSPKRIVRRSSLDMDLISDIGDNKAIGGGYVGALPASFASRMNYMQQAIRQSQLEVRKAEEKRRNEESEMFGRLMMARMNTLEEGFREVVHEVREGMKQVGSGMVSRQRSPEREIAMPKRSKKFKERQERQVSEVTRGGSGGSGIGSTVESVLGDDRLGNGVGSEDIKTAQNVARVGQDERLDEQSPLLSDERGPALAETTNSKANRDHGEEH